MNERMLRQISEAASMAVQLKMRISWLRDQNSILSGPLLSSEVLAKELISVLDRLELEADGMLAEQRRSKKGT